MATGVISPCEHHWVQNGSRRWWRCKRCNLTALGSPPIAGAPPAPVAPAPVVTAPPAVVRRRRGRRPQTRPPTAAEAEALDPTGAQRRFLAATGLPPTITTGSQVSVNLTFDRSPT